MKHSSPRRVQFFYFEAGGGHKSAANALGDVIAKRYPSWHIENVNLQQLLRPIDPVAKFTKNRLSVEGIYNNMLKRGWTYGSGTMIRALRANIRLHAPRIERHLRAHFLNQPADLVVSLIPHFNQNMFRALQEVKPGTPYATVITDIADRPPHFWQENQDQYMICGSEKAFAQAKARGYQTNKIIKVSGMILKPSFYELPNVSRGKARIELGLDPNKPTALIMFGGNGSKDSLKIVEQLAKTRVPTQSIVLCGHDQNLHDQLYVRDNVHPIGFTDRVPHFMQLADFFIGKPGPGSISEAVHSGLPVIVARNLATLAQERYNATWVKENKLGLVIKDYGQTAAAVDQLFRDNALEILQANTRSIQNRAVFEIPEHLDAIMKKTEATARHRRLAGFAALGGLLPR